MTPASLTLTKNRPISKLLLLTLCSPLLLNACSLLTGPLPIDHAWIEVKTEHITLLTDSGEADALVTARELELFHSQLVFHEYTHHLVRNPPDRKLARWFDEGFADVMRTFTLQEERFVIG